MTTFYRIAQLIAICATKPIQLANIEIAPVIDFEFIHGSLDSNSATPTTLIKNLENLKTRVARGDINKIGIIYDLDSSTPEQRIAMINNALQQAYQHTSPPLSAINQFINIQVDEELVHIACHFIHIDGQGEIENLLKAIKTVNSPFADCLYDGWKNCLSAKGRAISDKKLVKQWLSFYIRYDALSQKEMRDAANNTKLEAFLNLAPAKFDFNKDIPELNQLKDFLKLFAQTHTNCPAATPDDHAH